MILRKSILFIFGIAFALGCNSDPGNNVFLQVYEIPDEIRGKVGFDVTKLTLIADNNLNSGLKPKRETSRFLARLKSDNDRRAFILIKNSMTIYRLDAYQNGELKFRQGGHYHSSEKPFEYRHIVLPVDLKAGQPTDFYLEANSTGFVNVQFKVKNEANLVGTLLRDYYFLGAFAGMALVMIFYNLFLFLLIKEKVYLHYVFYTMMISLFIIQQDGLFIHLDFYHGLELTRPINFLVFILLPVSALFFLQSFLNLKGWRPRLNQAINVVIITGVVFAIANLATGVKVFPNIAFNLVFFLTLALSIWAIAAGLKARIKEARFLVIAFSFFITLSIVRVLSFLLPDFFTFLDQNLMLHAIKVATGFELVTLSMGLAGRYRSLRDRLQQTKIKFLEEKERLNREVHDNIGSELAGIVLQLREQNSDELILTRLQKALDNTRDITALLHYPGNSDSNLESDIRSFAANFSELKKFSFSIHFHNGTDSLTLKARLNIFRIIQEYVSNCIRHAQAKNFKLIFRVEKTVLLMVASDGERFSWSSKNEPVGPGMGLKSLFNRISNLQGIGRTFRFQGRNYMILRFPLAVVSQKRKHKR